MLYLNTTHLESMGVRWDKLARVIEAAVSSMAEQDFSQPVKPYLRYGNMANRIIAMPAYVGGPTSLAGIKWIASFPGNIHRNIQRAHSITILNQHDSGVPLCTINSSLVSAIRTAAVSCTLLTRFIRNKPPDRMYTVGIVGFGPIGRMHLQMVKAALGRQLKAIRLFDIKNIDNRESYTQDNISFAGSWQDCYVNSDIFITCTVSSETYINIPPPRGSLQLNVSLRDYKAEMRQYMDMIVVDDWTEVCRQNTDIENMHLKTGLQKEDTVSIVDVVCNNVLSRASTNDVVMFNPMGMAVFDIAVGGYYYHRALEENIGIQLPD